MHLQDEAKPCDLDTSAPLKKRLPHVKKEEEAADIDMSTWQSEGQTTSLSLSRSLFGHPLRHFGNVLFATAVSAAAAAVDPGHAPPATE